MMITHVNRVLGMCPMNNGSIWYLSKMFEGVSLFEDSKLDFTASLYTLNEMINIFWRTILALWPNNTELTTVAQSIYELGVISNV